MKVKVGARGTVVIPKPMREKLNIRKGDFLDVEAADDKLLMRKDTLWDRFKGSAKGVTTAEAVERELDAEERAWAKRLQR